MNSYNIEIIKNEKNKIRFKLYISNHLSNAIRYVCFSEVPTLAFENVSFISNSSQVTHDLYLAHRLGLIPIECNEKHEDIKYNIMCECDDYCESCSVVFKLNVKNTTNKYINVTSSDIQYKNENFKPLKNFPITKLNPQQELSFIAIAKKGIGKMHSKWYPVSRVSFTPVVNIKTNINMCNNLKEKKLLVETCHKKIFYLNESNNVDIEDIENCDLCKKCEKQSDKLKIIETNQKMGEIDSNGQLKSSYIFLKSIDVLLRKFKVLYNNLMDI